MENFIDTDGTTRSLLFRARLGAILAFVAAIVLVAQL